MKDNPLDAMRQEIYEFLDNSLPSEGRVAEAMRYSMLGARGGLLRPLVTAAVGRDYHLPNKAIVPIAAAQECAHVASLVLDDIHDKSAKRRGIRSCHYAFDKKTAELAVVDLLAQGRDFIRDSSINMAAKYAIIEQSDAMTHAIVRGQETDLYPINISTVDDILRFYGRKSGALFALATVAGGLAAETSGEDLAILRDIGLDLGIAYQIGDDIKDKTDDITAGKTTLLSIIGEEYAQQMWHVKEQSIRTNISALGERANIGFFGDVANRILWLHAQHIGQSGS